MPVAKPEQFARTWLHTHPGDCPTPSMTDEETFNRVFGRCDWAVMFVLARGGQTYARLRFNVGPGGEVVIPVQIVYSRPFAASNQEAWLAEYYRHVHIQKSTLWQPLRSPTLSNFDDELCKEVELLESQESRAFRDAWDDVFNPDESEVYP